jgi:hypothetical protein
MNLILNISKSGKCISDYYYSYICTMKNSIVIPDFLPVLKEEDIKTASDRRDKYALARDLQAQVDNEAIVRRLLRDSKSSSEDKV